MAPSQVDELVAFGRRQPLLVAGLAVGAFGIYRLAGGQFGSPSAVTDTAVDSGAPTPVPVSPSNSDPFGNGGDVLGGSAGYGGVGLTYEDLASAIADALAGSPAPTPTPTPTPTPGTLPGSVVCGALPSYPPAAGTRRICLNGRWQDVPIGTTLPPTTPRPQPPRVPTPTPPAPTPAATGYRLHVAAGAIVRVYKIDGTGRVTGYTDQRWDNPASSAPARPRSSNTAFVTGGAFANKVVRIGSLGVSLVRA